MFKFKRNVEYNVWVYKDGRIYLTKDYTNIFGVRKQKEIVKDRFYDILLSEVVKFNHNCE